jgi:hypothetical protein
MLFNEIKIQSNPKKSLHVERIESRLLATRSLRHRDQLSRLPALRKPYCAAEIWFKVILIWYLFSVLPKAASFDQARRGGVNLIY